MGMMIPVYTHVERMFKQINKKGKYFYDKKFHCMNVCFSKDTQNKFLLKIGLMKSTSFSSQSWISQFY